MVYILTGSHKDGVHLILPDGSSLNDRVNILLQPEWKKAMAAGQNPTDGVWYRAMCLEERAAKENNIIFLDFGNMAYIDKTNIHKMVPDYVRTPVVAVLRVLEGLKNSTEKLKQRVRELVQVNKIYKARVVSCSGPGIYSIELPHVTEVLTKENLLSSAIA